MLALFKGLWDFVTHRPEKRLVFLGLDNAGKTTSLEQLKVVYGKRGMDTSKIMPTIGFNVATLPINGCDAILWDLGGHAGFRVVWKKYFAETQAVIFVVDAADRARFPEAKSVLEGVMEDPTLLDLPLMIFANKQDLPGAASKDEIAEFFELRTLRQRCRRRKEGKVDQEAAEAAAKGSKQDESGTAEEDNAWAASDDESGKNFKKSPKGSSPPGSATSSARSITGLVNPPPAGRTVDQPIRVFPCSAVNNFGLADGVEWIVEETKKYTIVEGLQPPNPNSANHPNAKTTTINSSANSERLNNNNDPGFIRRISNPVVQTLCKGARRFSDQLGGPGDPAQGNAENDEVVVASGPNTKTALNVHSGGAIAAATLSKGRYEADPLPQMEELSNTESAPPTPLPTPLPSQAKAAAVQVGMDSFGETVDGNATNYSGTQAASKETGKDSSKETGNIDTVDRHDLRKNANAHDSRDVKNTGNASSVADGYLKEGARQMAAGI